MFIDLYAYVKKTKKKTPQFIYMFYAMLFLQESTDSSNTTIEDEDMKGRSDTHGREVTTDTQSLELNNNYKNTAAVHIHRPTICVGQVNSKHEYIYIYIAICHIYKHIYGKIYLFI